LPSLAQYAPLHRWLLLLADGWSFHGFVAEPMPHHHGYHAVLLVQHDEEFETTPARGGLKAVGPSGDEAGLK